MQQPGIRAVGVPVQQASLALPIHFGAFKEDGVFTSIDSVVERAVHQEMATLEPALSCSVTPRKQCLSPAGRYGCYLVDNHFSWWRQTW